MKDYFLDQFQFVKDSYMIKDYKNLIYEMDVETILGFDADDATIYIYKHYKEFSLTWFDYDGKYAGAIQFVPYGKLENEHDYMIESIKENYNIDLDELGIMEDIESWYPIFYFPNGDAFCIDIRDGHIVFYEHEVYDTGVNLHGLMIAKSISDLFYKWNIIHFADVYNWDEICNEEGIDVHSSLARKYID